MAVIPLPLGVIPVLLGPLQVLLTVLPGLLLSLLGGLLVMFKPAAMWRAAKLLWRLKLPVALTLTAVTGLVGAVAWARAGHGASGVAEVGSDWPMYRGGVARRGWAGGAGPTSGGLNWSFTEARQFYASPAVVGNRVYITSAEKGVFGDKGAVYCLDADTGALVWKSQPNGFRATFSSPSVAGKYLVTGEGLHFTRDGRVVCLDVTAGGKLLWQHRTASHVESSPCIADGRVYVGAGDDGYYCFELAPDAGGQPRLVWHISGKDFPDAESSPVVYDGKVLVGLGMGGNAVCCLAAATGQELWRVSTPYPVFGPPAVAQGKVFVAMGNGNYIQSAEEVRDVELAKLRSAGASESQVRAAAAKLGPGGEVWGIDLADPSKRWVFHTEQTVLGAVAAAEDKLVFGSRDGNVYTLTMDGKEAGRWNAGEPIVASPAVTKDHVYVITAGGRVYGMKLGTSEVVWSAAAGTEGRFFSAPAVGRGRLFVGTEAHGVVSLGQVGRAKPVIWAGALGGPGCGGVLQPSELPSEGAMLWRYPTGEPEGRTTRVSAPLAALDDRLFVGLDGPERKGLVCLSNEPSARAKPRELWKVSTAQGVSLSPAAGLGRVYVVDGKLGDAGRRLRCVAAEDGRDLWSMPVDAEATGQMLLSESAMYVQDAPGQLAALNPADGQVLWRQEVGPLAGMPALHGSMLLTANAAGRLWALDAPGGAVLWQTALDAPATAGPVVLQNTVFVGSAKALEARRVVDGSLLWRGEAGPPATALTLASGGLVYVSRVGELVLVNPETGKTIDRSAGAAPVMAPLWTGRSLLYAGEGQLFERGAASQPQSQPAGWMDISWMGEMTAPPVLVNSRLYFATKDRGLVRAGGQK